MAQGHEEMAAELHETFNERNPDMKQLDASGGFITRGSVDATADEKHAPTHVSSDLEQGDPTPDGEEPNEYEQATLRREGENLPMSAYLIAIVELCERFTYYGAQIGRAHV